MLSLLNLISAILSIIWWIVIASAIASWLVAFGVINTRNRGVYLVLDMLNRLTDPLLRPIRRLVPQFGGMDISPMILLLGIYFVQSLMSEYAYPAVMSGMYSR
jgi:YggT family protein